MKHVIVGDGVAGHTAAEKIREEDQDAEIHVFTREEVPFYDRIGLRDYVRGGREREDLILNGKDWYEEHGIELHLDTEIEEINRQENCVSTASGETFSYDRLLLAVGGHPRKLPIEEGVDRVHHLWNLEEHGRPLKRDLQDSDSGVVIGGGLLGFDLIGSFNQVVDATYLVREDRWWHSVLTEEGAEIVHEAMRENGVDLRLEEEARELEDEEGKVRVVTGEDGYRAGVVGVAVGHERNLDLAEDSGLETGGGIICDEHLRTSDPAIYAAGDAAEYFDPVLEERNLGGSWVTAQKQGETAGKNMSGNEKELEFVDTYTVNHFGLNVASLGDPADTEGKEVVTAVDRDERKYRKMVLDDGRVVGAAFIGEMKWMHPLKQLVKGKVDVSGRISELGETGFDLDKLLE